MNLQEINFGHPRPANDRLCIFGAGGAGREVAWSAQQIWGDSVKLCFVVDQPQYLTGTVNDIPVALLSQVAEPAHSGLVVAVGDTSLRRKASAACEQLGMHPATLVHPGVVMSDRVSVGAGTIIGAGCTLTTDIEIGDHVYLNIGCTISHDVSIGDFVTMSPGCHIAGHVRIEPGVFLGAGVTIINGSSQAPLTIGTGAVIAAGACVIDPVPPGKMVAGVPAVTRR